MQFKTALFKSILSAGLLATALQAHGLAIVVHPSNQANIDQQAIARIFLGQITVFPNGNEAVPLTLYEGTEAVEQFNRKVLHKTGVQIKAHWSKLLFTGRGRPPEELPDDETILELVASDPRAIGIISGAPSKDVKVISTL